MNQCKRTATTSINERLLCMYETRTYSQLLVFFGQCTTHAYSGGLRTRGILLNQFTLFICFIIFLFLLSWFVAVDRPLLCDASEFNACAKRMLHTIYVITQRITTIQKEDNFCHCWRFRFEDENELLWFLYLAFYLPLVIMTTCRIEHWLTTEYDWTDFGFGLFDGVFFDNIWFSIRMK